MMSYKYNIPVNTPLLDGKERDYLNECIDSGWISSEGPFVRRFEDELAAKVNQSYGVAVSSGTAALEVAIAALNIEKGDEVILPSHTIISCAQAIVKNMATPVFIDNELNTWNMDVSKIERKITQKTKAIMVVHLYGFPVDMDPVLQIAKKYNLYIIEDTAQMLGQNYKGVPCGSFGDISTFSFYPNKVITTGEGGMCVTSNPEIANRCKSLRNLCFEDNNRFHHSKLGWNYRMTNLQAAIGLAQLEKLDRNINRKRQIGNLYYKLLSDNPNFKMSPPQHEFSDNIYWVVGIMLSSQLKNNAKYFMSKLGELGIGTRPFFFPMHLQPVFKDYEFFNSSDLHISEKLYEYGFYIPCGLGIKDNEIRIVSSELLKIFK
jgi:perosamine synthetase